MNVLIVAQNENEIRSVLDNYDLRLISIKIICWTVNPNFLKRNYFTGDGLIAYIANENYLQQDLARTCNSCDYIYFHSLYENFTNYDLQPFAEAQKSGVKILKQEGLRLGIEAKEFSFKDFCYFLDCYCCQQKSANDMLRIDRLSDITEPIPKLHEFAVYLNKLRQL